MLLGRTPKDLLHGWGFQLARDALKDSDVEVRDEAITLLEHLRGFEALSILKEHHDSNGWLNEWVQTVVTEIEDELKGKL